MLTPKRSDENPILSPLRKNLWESEGAFNGCPVKDKNKIHFLYRAQSYPHFHFIATDISLASIGYANSQDGIHFKNRRRLIKPEKDWEKFGCEDPRVTKINDKFYIFYTALSEYPPNPEGIKIGAAITKDFKKIDEKHLVTHFNSKAMALFPQKINNKLTAILTANTDKPPSKIAIIQFNNESDIWSSPYWESWYNKIDNFTIPLQRSSDDHVEVGAPPLKTKYGWLVIYSHIENYFSSSRRFGIEAALLDLNNPYKIIGRTKDSILSPEEEYELYGKVPNIVFPSGAFIEKNKVYLYYGAADTRCCLATFDLKDLIKEIISPPKPTIVFERFEQNPIISPNPNHNWESKATFNPAAIYEDNKVHIIYRAMSADNTSVFGYASSLDGLHIDERLPEPIYVPRENFEKKAVPGNSGCEDPRITKINDRFYMCYTAFNAKDPHAVAMTSISVEDFLKKRWVWEKPIIISSPGVADKNACIFPEKVGGNYIIFHRVKHCINLSYVKNLDFLKNKTLEEHRWVCPREDMWDSLKIGIVAPPIKTDKGWLLLYHGLSAKDGKYRVGAMLLKLKDPEKIIARTNTPIFEPETEYEKQGEISNVVFPCGNVVIGNQIFIYYGGADKVVAVASMEIEKLLSVLIP